MLFWIIIKSAFKSLVANKFRSFLAMLGIIIGVGAVIATLAIGAGARASVMERLSILGTDLLVVRPGQSRGSRGVSRGALQNLTVADAEAIVAQSQFVKQVAPTQSGRTQVVHSGRNVNTTIMGTTVTYFPIRNFLAEKGRVFTEIEMERKIRVAVIGPATAEELFDQEDPLGKTIRIKKTNFTVVGVLKAKGDQGWFNPDDQVIIPIPIAITQIFGRERLREINVQAAAGVPIEAGASRSRANHAKPAPHRCRRKPMISTFAIWPKSSTPIRRSARRFPFSWAASPASHSLLEGSES